ncbi:L-type lectin-domain containing receptor kinase VIII.2-like [Bidens hawaiensis]|uniref:L-type lectin-domain containing receptor kinase VIII.2-like n=1 Tax=Bidens hawaiensis TaxID=980011 RepID=UPI00404914F4
MALKHLILLCFFTSYLKSLTAVSNSSFTFKNFGQNSSFDSVLSLYGGAKVVNDGQSLQLTTGRVIYKNPIKFYSGTPQKLVSFETYFEFSMTSGSRNGDGFVFVVFSGRDDLFDGNGSFGVSNRDGVKFLSVEFDTLMDDKYGDINGNHVGIDLSSFVSLKVVNLSSVDLGLNSDTRLQVWIDYEAGSRRLEVRVNKFGENRPLGPLLFGQIDITKIWPENDGFFVGLSSFNGNSSQIFNLYSWSFKTRQQPDWMHSEPLDPVSFKGKGKEIKVHKENDCVLWIVSALILGVGLGALGSFVGMLMWTVFAKRRPIAPEEYAVKPVVDEKSLSK